MKVAYSTLTLASQFPETFDNRHNLVYIFMMTANLMMVLLQILNIYWFYGIIRGVHRVITKGLNEAKSGSRDADMTKKTGVKKD